MHRFRAARRVASELCASAEALCFGVAPVSQPIWRIPSLAPAISAPSRAWGCLRQMSDSTNSIDRVPHQTPKDVYMAFTCGKCGTRAVKGFTRQSYEHGIVIVTCPSCEVKHLIADNLGWFGDNGNVEDFVKEKGGQALRISADGTVEFEEVVGRSTLTRSLSNDT